MFKKGDRVKRVACDGKNVKVGDVLTVQTVIQSTIYFVETGSRGFNVDYFVLVDFVVGDIVLRTRGEHAGMFQGDIGTVSAVEPNGLQIEEFNKSAHDARNFVIHKKAEKECGVPALKDLKFDQDKIRHALLMQGCPNALNGVAEVLTFGAKKYEAHSWQKVTNNVERYYGALYRHLNLIEQGEDLDQESGLPHIYHAACNLLFLAELRTINKDKQ